MSRREMLEESRDVLLSRLRGDVEDRSVAGIVRELRAVLKDIDDLPVAKEGDPLDDVTAQRARRQARAKVS